MAAPVFSKSDVLRLIAMPKHVRYDDWQADWKSREGSVPAVKIKAFPNDEDEDIEFIIERVDRRDRGEVTLNLYVKLPELARAHPLCRYDLQNLRHRNPKWFTPKIIPSRTFHKHVYNERAVRENLPKDWALCAEPIDIKPERDFQRNLSKLLRVFLEELHIEMHDRIGQQTLGGW